MPCCIECIQTAEVGIRATRCVPRRLTLFRPTASRTPIDAAQVLSVKSAEAEAESKYLAGVGVARQRKAIVDGLKNSISDFTSNEQIKGASSKDVVDLLLITQYFDMLNAIGTRPDTLTVFIDEDGE